MLRGHWRGESLAALRYTIALERIRHAFKQISTSNTPPWLQIHLDKLAIQASSFTLIPHQWQDYESGSFAGGTQTPFDMHLKRKLSEGQGQQQPR